jgi:DNA repair exonuclease SbcCD nuclease subunit
MSKICLITDQHFGARGDALVYLNFFDKFYTDIFFPTLKERNIKTVIDLGDTFDRRKYINFLTLCMAKKMYFDRLVDLDIKLHVIVGNHTTFYKNTNEINTIDTLFSEYPNIEIYSHPQVKRIENLDILFLPWICAENYSDSMKLINEVPASVALGHLEVSGFAMHVGQTSEEGLNPNIFDQYKLVCSGHYHHRSTKGNITYLGNPYEFTWNDYADQRGFHILDTETLELEFIPNPYTIFDKIYYDDEKNNYKDFSFKHYTNKNIKLVVVNKKDFYTYDKFIDGLYAAQPLDLKIVEDFSEFLESQVDDESVNIEDTMSLLSTYVDAIETDMSRDKIKNVLKTLYIEAQTYKDK